MDIDLLAELMRLVGSDPERYRLVADRAPEKAVGAHRLDEGEFEGKRGRAGQRRVEMDLFGPDAEIDLAAGRAAFLEGIAGEADLRPVRRPQDRVAVGDELAGDEVHGRRADEAGDEAVDRPLVDLLRRGELLD